MARQQWDFPTAPQEAPRDPQVPVGTAAAVGLPEIGAPDATTLHGLVVFANRLSNLLMWR